jgi:hypothetical protein
MRFISTSIGVALPKFWPEIIPETSLYVKHIGCTGHDNGMVSSSRDLAQRRDKSLPVMSDA